MTDIARKKTIQTYYSSRAKDYDKQKSRTWKSDRGFGTEVLEEMRNAFRNFQNKLLLEVGVGSGRNATLLLEIPKLHLVGLDLTKQMLDIARKKSATHKQNIDLVLGDAEHAPFKTRTFDGILCMSTLHYLANQEQSLTEFAHLLKRDGIFVYGDLSPHESDNQGFFEALERTVSKAHARYYKASEMNRILENRGFRVIRTKIIPYRKSYDKLMKDKAKYFDVSRNKLQGHLDTASNQTKKQYALTDTELTQLYMVVVASKLDEPK